MDPKGFYTANTHTKVSAKSLTGDSNLTEFEFSYNSSHRNNAAKDYKGRFEDLDDVDPTKEDQKDLENEYYPLFTRQIVGFAINKKEWRTYDL